MDSRKKIEDLYQRGLITANDARYAIENIPKVSRDVVHFKSIGDYQQIAEWLLGHGCDVWVFPFTDGRHMIKYCDSFGNRWVVCVGSCLMCYNGRISRLESVVS